MFDPSSVDLYRREGETITQNLICSDGRADLRISGMDPDDLELLFRHLSGTFSGDSFLGTYYEHDKSCGGPVFGKRQSTSTGAWHGTGAGLLGVEQANWVIHVEPNGGILSMTIDDGSGAQPAQVSGGVNKAGDFHVEGICGDHAFIIDARPDMYGQLQGIIHNESGEPIGTLSGELDLKN
jgi:hypothetical protein